MIKYIDEANKVLNPFERSIEPTRGDRGWGSFGEVRKIDAGRRRVYAVLSSNAIDRYGEIVDPRGFEPWMDRFRSNPVFLKDHDHKTQIGHWEGMKLTDTTLEGWAVFANTPTAEEQWILYRDGHRKAFSVGFLTHKWEMREVEMPDGSTKRVRVFVGQEPVEGSGVAVPANHEALARVAGLVASSLNPKSNTDLPDGDLKQFIEATVDRAVAKSLDASPISHLSHFVQDVVEATLDRVGYLSFEDYDVRRTGEPDRRALYEGEEELKQSLRDVLDRDA